MHPFNKPFIHSTNYYLIVGLNTGRCLEDSSRNLPKIDVCKGFLWAELVPPTTMPSSGHTHLQKIIKKNNLLKRKILLQQRGFH